MNWPQKIIQRIKQSTLFSVIVFIVLVTSFVLTMMAGYSAFKSIYANSIGRKSILLDNIGKLSAGTNIDYFTKTFGNPVFINNWIDPKTNKKTIYRENIFVNDLFYLQAVTDESGKVVLYSVTTRKADFNPKISTIVCDTEPCRPLVVELGKTRFNQLDQLGQPERIMSIEGAHDFFYSEEYYFGNPANYQTFIFSLNEAGYMGIEDMGDNLNSIPPDVVNADINNPEIQKFRESGVINTYTVTVPSLGEINDNRITINMPFNPPIQALGPDYNDVRILSQ